MSDRAGKSGNKKRWQAYVRLNTARRRKQKGLKKKLLKTTFVCHCMILFKKSSF